MSTAAALVDALFTRKNSAPAPARTEAAARVPARDRVLSGQERAAILLLALGETYGAEVWKLLDDEEIRQISLTMSTLGTIDSEAVERLMIDFVGQMSTTGALMGDSTATERLLAQLLPAERVAQIMASKLRGAVSAGSAVAAAMEAKQFAEQFPGRVNQVMDALAAGAVVPGGDEHDRTAES